MSNARTGAIFPMKLSKLARLRIFNSILLIILLNTVKNYPNIAPLDFFLPDDPNFVVPIKRGYKFQFESLNQFGLKDIDARRDIVNPISEKTIKETVNVLQMWDANQSTLNMIRGFPPDSMIGQLAAKLNMANDDGIRGHMVPTADLKGQAFSWRARFKIRNSLSLNVSLPFYHFKLSNVVWQDLTQSDTAADILTKQYLTDDFFATVAELGQGLNVQDGWSRLNIGDTMVELRWDQDFPQPTNPRLKNVALSLRSGLTLPTGLRQNEDLLFAFPYGNDGATGITFGGGIDLDWFHIFHGNINIDFLELFGSSRDRRIKVFPDQTSLIFLEKTYTRLKPGLTQRYNLGLSAKIYRGLNFGIAYEHMKHNRDTIALYNNSFSNEVANTASCLQDWTTHDFILKLAYYGRSNFHLFYKHPFNGRRTLLNSVAGFEFSVDF